jgi:hypothetical protein
MSERAAARHFGIDRKTVSKILKHSVPPGYRRAGSPQSLSEKVLRGVE